MISLYFLISRVSGNQGKKYFNWNLMKTSSVIIFKVFIYWICKRFFCSSVFLEEIQGKDNKYLFSK